MGAWTNLWVMVGDFAASVCSDRIANDAMRPTRRRTSLLNMVREEEESGCWNSSTSLAGDEVELDLPAASLSQRRRRIPTSRDGLQHSAINMEG